MAEGLKEVIAKLKAQQNSQQSPRQETKPVKKIEVPAIPDEDSEEFLENPEENEEETPKDQEKNEQKSEKIDPEQQKAMEIELLQNNGRFRAELLYQLQEINKALVVIAGVLVDQHGAKS